MFVRKETSYETLPSKQSGVFFTNHKAKLIEIIRQLDEEEFKEYGTDKNGKMVIPVYEIEPIAKGIFLLPDDLNSYADYYGKFDIDLKALKEKCEEAYVEYYLHIFEKNY